MKANPMFEELRYLVKSNEVRETGRKLNKKQEELRVGSACVYHWRT